jgi:hypothetical protein
VRRRRECKHDGWGRSLSAHRSIRSASLETIMAKGQKRSDREIRKPKATKQPATEAAPAVLMSGMPSSINPPKIKR